MEGRKNVEELLRSDYKIEALFYTQEFEERHQDLLNSSSAELKQLSNISDLEKAGTFKSNDAAIAIVRMKEAVKPNAENELVICLDDVRDPGNLGTIIRIADWYGIKNVFCSDNSADFYNPKVISSTMGSFCRINPYYGDLTSFLEAQNSNTPIVGAFMDGDNIYQSKLAEKGILVMGNESNGISEQIEGLINKKITIPRFGEAESLNVAIATAVILDNYKRQ